MDVYFLPHLGNFSINQWQDIDIFWSISQSSIDLFLDLVAVLNEDTIVFS